MRTVVALGLRLAWGTPGQRGRSALVALAAGVGSLLLVAVVAVAGAERRTSLGGYSDLELQRLAAIVLVVVGLPVVVLAATVARLSASLRDRRLGNLRLLGLPPARTRLVAASEAAGAAAAGATVGALAFWLLRSALGQRHLLGRDWTVDELHPGAPTYALAPLALTLVVAAVAALPQRLGAAQALARARRADVRRPSPWRAAPLALGLALGAASWDIGGGPDHTISAADVTVLFAAITLIGLGVVMIVPVFVRLLADLLQRWSRRPVTLIAARRLQAQPAAVTRLVAALMVGLFLVTGARAVVVAFESTPQYEDAALNVEVEQRAAVGSRAGRVERDVAAARAITGVRSVVTFPTLHGNPGTQLRRNAYWPVTALVGTCADLARLAPDVTNCVDGEPMTLTPWWSDEPPARITLAASRRASSPATLTIATPSKSMRGDDDNPERQQLIRPASADVFLPTSTPGLAPLLRAADRTSVVIADPGRNLEEDLWEAGLTPQSGIDLANYDFVGSLRTLVWSVAAVILGLGLLTFGVAAVDRAVSRRREVISLRVVGTPPGVLRRAQWLEAALPTATGAVLAIAAGLFAGATYLRLDDEAVPPWRQSLGLALVALVAAALVAGLTVVAGGGRIRPDHLRTE